MPDFMEKAATMLCAISDIADRLVRSEMTTGVKREEAERALARRIGLARSTFENLRRGRLKNVEIFGAKIRAAFVAELERQIAKLESELAVARAVDRPIDFDAVEAAIRTAKEKLGKG